MNQHMTGRGHDTAPMVVEPQMPAVTTIPVTPQTHIEVTRRGGCTRLALVAHTPPPYVIAGGGGQDA